MALVTERIKLRKGVYAVVHEASNDDYTDMLTMFKRLQGLNVPESGRLNDFVYVMPRTSALEGTTDVNIVKADCTDEQLLESFKQFGTFSRAMTEKWVTGVERVEGDTEDDSDDEGDDPNSKSAAQM